jgi:NitT/TauT family transport system substrate-binding protein
MRIGIAAPERIATLPLKLAELLGYFDDEKLTVEFDSLPLGVDTAPALRAGRIDVACNQASLLLAQPPDAARVRAFLSLVRYPGYVLTASPQARALRRIEDLAGAKIGVLEEDRDSQLLLRYVLGRRNVGWESVELARFPKPEPLVEALGAGKVNAGLLLEPHVAQMQSRHPKTARLLDLRNGPGVVEAVGAAEYPGPVLSATAEWIAGNRAAGEGLARALRRTLLWMSSRTASQIVARVPVEFRQPDEAIYVEALVATLPAFSMSGELTPDAAAALARVWKYAHPEAPPPLGYEDVFTSEFLDLAGAR